jgi:hypothetical protein
VILSTLLMLQAATAPLPIVNNDVVVIGQRLEKDFKANVKFDKNGPQCRVAKSTGDAEIDRIGCTALEVCFPQFQSRFEATRDRAIRPEVRKVMQGALNQELAGCFAGERTSGIAALAAKRRAARGGR